jgi:hypothetical protein
VGGINGSTSLRYAPSFVLLQKTRMDRKDSSRDVEKVNMWGGTLKAQ